MSDSVGACRRPPLSLLAPDIETDGFVSVLDRVFVHALNTVKRIPRTGTARPPAAERLKLYGLYKQSMGEWARETDPRCQENAHDSYLLQRGTWKESWIARLGIPRRCMRSVRSGTLPGLHHSGDSIEPSLPRK